MIIKANDFCDAWLKLNEAFVVYEKRTVLGWNPTIQARYLKFFELLIKVRNPNMPSLYLEDLCYSTTGQKFGSLCSKYLDRQLVVSWLDKIQTHKNIDSPVYLPTKQHGFNKGSCIVGFSFRNSPSICLTVFYRALEMPTKAGADFFLISALARLVKECTGKPIPLVVIFADIAWINSRSAVVYLMYKKPTRVKYHNVLFNKAVQDVWKTYFINGKPFSSGSGRRLQTGYHELIEKNPKRIDQEQCYLKLKSFLKEGKT